MTTDEELNLLEQQLRRLKIEYEMYFNNPAKRPPTDVEWKVLAILRKFSDGGRMGFAQRFRYNALAQQYAVQSDLWRKKSRIREEGYRRPQDALLGVQGVRIFEDKPENALPGNALNEAVAPQEITPLEIDEDGSDTLEAVAAAAAAVVEKPMAPWPVAAAASQAPAPPSPAPKAPAKPAKAKPSPKQPYCAHLTDVEKDRKHVESLYQALVEAKKNAGEKLGDAASFDSFSSFVKKKTDQIRKQYHCEAVEYSVELEAGKVRLKAKAGSKA